MSTQTQIVKSNVIDMQKFAQKLRERQAAAAPVQVADEYDDDDSDTGYQRTTTSDMTVHDMIMMIARALKYSDKTQTKKYQVDKEDALDAFFSKNAVESEYVDDIGQWAKFLMLTCEEQIREYFEDNKDKEEYLQSLEA